MAYEHRLRILVLLLDGEQTPSMLALALALDAALVAHHLRHLLVARLVHRRRRGRYVFYGVGSVAGTGRLGSGGGCYRNA